MKVGIALNMLSQEGRPDWAVVSEHTALADLAEPLGFDSIFALEHHFTGYAMSPSPVELLAYFAGRTKRVTLGSSVIVLPWHDPIRVAEQIALLDVLCGGRCLFGFGRGAARVEYEGFRIPMGEARPRMDECIQIVKMALTQPEFEFQGEFYKIPRTSIRPAPMSHPERRFYGAANSPESAKLLAGHGFGLLIVMHNEWAKAASEVHEFHAHALAAGQEPRAPIIVSNIACAETHGEARDMAEEWLGRKWDSVENHYRFADGGLSQVKGYEAYDKIGKTYAKMKDPETRRKMTETYVRIQIVGTPDECIDQIRELRALTGLDHLVCEFSYGGMPHDASRLNMQRFADKVLPVLHHDPAFMKKPDIVLGTGHAAKPTSDTVMGFVPA